MPYAGEEDGMSEGWVGPGRVRTSDAEREQVATVLRAAVTEGRLSLDEGDGRLALAYRATYRDELAPLTADLPGGGWDALARTPEARVAASRGLRRHGYAVVFVSGLLVAAWLISGTHVFWPMLPLLFLMFGLMRHARRVRYGVPGWYERRPPWASPQPPWAVHAGRPDQPIHR
jgi:hypothetical protein